MEGSLCSSQIHASSPQGRVYGNRRKTGAYCVLQKCFSSTLHLTLNTNLCRMHCYHHAFCITGETKARAFLKPVGGHPVGKRWRQDLNPDIWVQSKALNYVLLSLREWMKDCTKLNPSFLMRRLWRYSLFGVLESQVRNGHSADGP